MGGRELFSKYEKVILFLVRIVKCFPVKVRKWLFTRLRYTKGYLGIVLRYIFLKSIAQSVGKNVGIDEGCFILNPEHLSIGDNVSINPMCYIECWGGVKIGDDVSIAHSVTIMSVTHNYDDLNCPIKYQGLTPLPVDIQNDIWLGAKSTILGGVLIENGAIVGANALVKKNVPTNSIVAGVPAKIIKYRTSNEK